MRDWREKRSTEGGGNVRDRDGISGGRESKAKTNQEELAYPKKWQFISEYVRGSITKMEKRTKG